jgi:IS30 family transposase
MASQLIMDEREQIAQFRSQGLSRAEIGRRLGRHPTTIGRELARNSEGGAYWPSRAQQKAGARRGVRSKKLEDPALQATVRAGLAQRWSPEQIAGRLRRERRGDRRRRVSHTTIYRWIRCDPDRGWWESCLRFGSRRKTPETRGKLPARPDIAGRPDVVDERCRFGDWEGDTVVGKGRRGGLVTLVERKSGFALMGQVKRLKARNVARCVNRQFAELPAGLRRTMTFDNGKEFADHEQISDRTDLDIYFARPYHAWERGTNESFNGLVRQFFPKGTDLAGIGSSEVKRVLSLLTTDPANASASAPPEKSSANTSPLHLKCECASRFS